MNVVCFRRRQLHLPRDGEECVFGPRTEVCSMDGRLDVRLFCNKLETLFKTEQTAIHTAAYKTGYQIAVVIEVREVCE